jgi:hypothetical protein
LELTQFNIGITGAFNNWWSASGSNKACRQDVRSWIDLSWKNINISTIQNSWRHCGIKHKGIEENSNVIDAERFRSDNDPLI